MSRHRRRRSYAPLVLILLLAVLAAGLVIAAFRSSSSHEQKLPPPKVITRTVTKTATRNCLTPAQESKLRDIRDELQRDFGNIQALGSLDQFAYITTCK